eukprot:Skav227882  [mRNA]  locus=scaffold2896:447005:448701:+ [translate_table: standard]
MPGSSWTEMYDVTKFAGVHPGGTQILLEYAGKAVGARRRDMAPAIGLQAARTQDATEDFYALHRLEVLDKYQRLKKGRLADAKGPPPKKAHFRAWEVASGGIGHGMP